MSIHFLFARAVCASRKKVSRKLSRRLESGQIANSYKLSIALRDGIGEGDLAGFQIQFSFRGRAKYTCAGDIELAFPACNDRRCETITDHVYARAAHIHQFVHAEYDRDTYGSKP